jgi:hypothetical protein
MASESPTPIKLDRPPAEERRREAPERSLPEAPEMSPLEARHAARVERSAEIFRMEMMEEIVAMLQYATSNGLAGSVEPIASETFDRLAAGGEPPAMAELMAAHHVLKLLISPATPAGVRAYGQARGGRARLLGPNGTVQRLSIANIFFMALFFATSLSSLINTDTIHLSVYEQSGTPLLFKLMFLTAVSGIGASFAVLFEAWEDIRRRRFDPVLESSYWLQIGLGVVAGIVLTEIVQTGAPGQDPTSVKAPLVALAGGFSAGLLHVVLSRVVKAIRNIFEPAESK